MANRYMNTFREPILEWNLKLNAVADVVQLMAEIQRSWLCEPASRVVANKATAFPHPQHSGWSGAKWLMPVFCRSMLPLPLVLAESLVPHTCPADLESLFIDSEEVRRELPEATERFARIDGELAYACMGVLQPHSLPGGACAEGCLLLAAQSSLSPAAKWHAADLPPQLPCALCCWTLWWPATAWRAATRRDC